MEGHACPFHRVRSREENRSMHYRCDDCTVKIVSIFPEHFLRWTNQFHCLNTPIVKSLCYFLNDYSGVIVDRCHFLKLFTQTIKMFSKKIRISIRGHMRTAQTTIEMWLVTDVTQPFPTNTHFIL